MNPVYSKQALKAINNMDVATKQRIKKGIENIPNGDIRPLRGYTDGRQRLRIGKYRVIFIVKGEDLHIIDIGSRGDIYN